MRVSGEAGCAPKRFKRCHSKASLGEIMARAMREAETSSHSTHSWPHAHTIGTRRHTHRTTGTARLHFGVAR